MVFMANTSRFTDWAAAVQDWFVTPQAITIELMRFIGESELGSTPRGNTNSRLSDGVRAPPVYLGLLSVEKMHDIAGVKCA
jgi:hypothetical protein